MKRQFSSFLVATAVIAGSLVTPVALNNVKAASVQQKQTVFTEKFIVNGKSSNVQYTVISKARLYSSKELAKLMGASIVHKQNSYTFTKTSGNKKLSLTLTAKSTTAMVNGKKVKLAIAPRVVGNTLFVDANELVKDLGGDVLNQSTGKFIATSGLIAGDSYNPQWINDSTLLINNSIDSNSYVVNVTSKKAVLKINGIETVASPDGKKVIYADGNGTYLEDLSTGKVSTLNSTDTNPKFDFVWSNDGTKVYFIEGSSMTDVDSINLSDGSITTILTDSNAKGDLALSADGKKLLYTVGKQGTTTYTDPNNTDVSGIDLTNTQSQINVLDLTASPIAAVQLTNTTDNKIFPAFLPNGNIVYTSYDSSGATLPVLEMIDANKVISPLVTKTDIATTEVTAQGKLIIVTNERNGYHNIKEVDPATKQITVLAKTKLEITSISFSADGKHMAITVPGKVGDVVMVLNNGKFDELTK